MLLCGVCFVFWSTLVFLLVFSPGGGILNFFVSWFSIGFTAVSFRFLFVLIKELADHYYTLNASHDHHH